MNNSRRLLDAFRAAIAKSDNKEGVVEIFDQYSERFAQLYEARGERLLDSELALRDQTPKTEVKKGQEG